MCWETHILDFLKFWPSLSNNISSLTDDVREEHKTASTLGFQFLTEFAECYSAAGNNKLVSLYHLATFLSWKSQQYCGLFNASDTILSHVNSYSRDLLEKNMSIYLWQFQMIFFNHNISLL